MPYFDSNDPRDYGWPLEFRGFVPFSYGGHSFPQGVHPLAVPVFTMALDRLTAAGLRLPPVSMGLEAGMWGQEDRETKSGGSISFHQWGLAVDICAPWNPWRDADPPASPFRLPDWTSELVEPLGLLWGGSPRWGNSRDRMHVQCNASPDELAALPGPHPTPGPVPPIRPGHTPFPLPVGCYFGPYSGPTQSISGSAPTDARYRPGLRLAQGRLGVAADGLYGPVTALAATRFQQAHHLTPDGLIGPRTWAALGL